MGISTQWDIHDKECRDGLYSREHTPTIFTLHHTCNICKCDLTRGTEEVAIAITRSVGVVDGSGLVTEQSVVSNTSPSDTGSYMYSGDYMMEYDIM